MVTGGAVVTLVGSFLPWLRTGARTRSSYELFQIAERLGFASGGAVEWVLRLWPLVPFLSALVVTLQWWHPTRLLQWLGALVLPTICAAAIVGVVVVLLVFAPDISLFRIGIGPIVTGIGGGLMLIGAGYGLVGR